MQHSKKKKKEKAPVVEIRPRAVSEPAVPSQGITGDAKVASNLRSRSRLYWLFSCCGSVIQVNTPTEMEEESEKSE